MQQIFEKIFERYHDFFQSQVKHGTLKALIITIILFIIVEYFLLLPINLRSLDFVFCLMICLLVFVGLRSLFSLSFDKLNKICLVVVGGLVVYGVLGEFTSLPLFHAAAYQQQLTFDQDADFYEDNEKVNYQSIPVVDKESAQQLGDRKMGEIAEYVSQFEVDDSYEQINYNDKPFRVTTLSYGDLIKWLTNHREGLPAYIRVDMVTQESEVVRLQEGMKYSYSDLFLRNIVRHIRLHYPTKMFENPTFEIDDDGNPYWIAPVYTYQIGCFGGKDIIGAILVNAINGECQYYDIADIPTWIDRVYPANLLLTQLENWGQYTYGYLNTLFSQKGVLKPTDGYNYLALNDDVYIYTGLTSVSSDASNVGFALINMRTKEAKYYAISGAEEYSAMSSAEGKVQNLKYQATFPILINAGGQPTYFLSLKDDAGLVKQYAFVSVENYQIVAIGETVAEAEKAYYQMLSENNEDINTDFETVTISGQIVAISEAVVEGNSHYYFQIEGYDQIFIAPISLNDGLPLLVSGDTVMIEYIDNQDEAETITSIQILNQ